MPGLAFDLGGTQRGFLDAMIASGRYADAASAIQAGLRLLEQEPARGDALPAALEAGGHLDFDLDDSLAEMRRKRSALS